MKQVFLELAGTSRSRPVTLSFVVLGICDFPSVISSNKSLQV